MCYYCLCLQSLLLFIDLYRVTLSAFMCVPLFRLRYFRIPRTNALGRTKILGRTIARRKRYLSQRLEIPSKTTHPLTISLLNQIMKLQLTYLLLVVALVRTYTIMPCICILLTLIHYGFCVQTTAEAFLWNPICYTFFKQGFIGSIFCKQKEETTSYPDLTQEKTETYIGWIKHMWSVDEQVGPSYVRGSAPGKRPKGGKHKKSAKGN